MTAVPVKLNSTVNLITGALWTGSLLTPLAYPGNDDPIAAIIFSLEYNYSAFNTWECLGHEYCDTYVYNSVSTTMQAPDGPDEISVSTTVPDDGDFMAKVYIDRVCIDKDGVICADYEFYGITDASNEKIDTEDVDGILGLAPENENGTPSYASALFSAGIIDQPWVTFYINFDKVTGSSTSYVTFGTLDPAVVLTKGDSSTYKVSSSSNSAIQTWSLQANLAIGEESVNG